MAIQVPLPPDISGLDAMVVQVESLRPDLTVPLAGGGAVIAYREVLYGGAEVLLRTTSGDPVATRSGHESYVGGWLDDVALNNLLADACRKTGIPTLDLPDGVRIRDTGRERFWFNYTNAEVTCHGTTLPAASVLRVGL